MSERTAEDIARIAKCEACEPAFPGLTKREYFAAVAMQGAMMGLGASADKFEPDEPILPDAIARDAVKMADALLKELAK